MSYIIRSLEIIGQDGILSGNPDTGALAFNALSDPIADNSSDKQQ